ncbi:MAG: 50S ribosomal protein L3 [Fidelibacterota bacterium]
MSSGLIGRKIGMTQLFLEDGTAVPVTLVSAGPCVVVQKKTVESDGYEAVQIGLVEKLSACRVTRARKGHFDKANLPPCRILREFPVDGEAGPEVGHRLNVSIFKADQVVDVIGFSRGRGFAGVIKRHGFGGGRATHGSMFHRAPGSIGASAYPSRVIKGMRGPGQMGNKRITVKNLKIVKIDEAKNLLFLRGGVPGAPNAYLMIHHARKG